MADVLMFPPQGFKAPSRKEIPSLSATEKFLQDIDTLEKRIKVEGERLIDTIRERPEKHFECQKKLLELTQELESKISSFMDCKGRAYKHTME